MTDLQAHLAYWQTALGLSAWQIDLRVVRSWDMPVQDAAGCCRRTPTLCRALIHLLDEQDHGPSAWPPDLEVTLVHELLHCYHFTPTSGTAADLLEEQGVELTARALVRLRREAAAR